MVLFHSILNKEFQNAQIHFPIVLASTRSEVRNFYARRDYITLFYPTLYSVDRRATIPQVLAQSLGKSSYPSHKFRRLFIYLIDSSDLPSIYALAKDMAVSFPKINWLYLLFERRCDIVSFLSTTITAPQLIYWIHV